MIVVEPIPAFEDNYLWLAHDAAHPGAGAVVVDPGDALPVLRALAARGLRLAAVLVTHHHADHVGGIAELRTQFPEIPVYGPHNERVPERTVSLYGGETVEPLPGWRLEVLAVPGHTRGHIAYQGGDMLFCGDTLFTAGCGKVFDGTVPQLYASLQRIAALADGTRVFCAHEYTLENLAFALAVEPENADILARTRAAERLRAEGRPTVPSTLREEKRTNPFLRTSCPSVVAAAERFARRPLEPGEPVFAIVRYWRDVWRQ